MNEIITRAIEDLNVEILAQLPNEILTDEEKDLIVGVQEYQRKHGSPASLKWVLKNHDWFIPFKFTPTPTEPTPAPITAVLEDEIQRRLLVLTETKLREIQNEMNLTGKVPLGKIKEIETLNVLTTGANKFSTFDRKKYFRRGVVHLPFKVIDSAMGGLANGDFLLLIGRLGTGKSTLAQHIAKVFWDEGKRVVFVSAEMLAEDVFAKLDAMVEGFNPNDLRKGSNPTIMKTLDSASLKAKSGSGEIIIPKQRIIEPARIGAFAKSINADAIFVDGVYLLNPSIGHVSSKWERVAAVSNELKQVALDLELPLIGTTQIKRGASGSDGFDPEDISYSDALGQDADFIIANHPSKLIENQFELQLIKNRYGPNCATNVTIDFDSMTFEDSYSPAPTTVSAASWTKGV